MQNEGASFKILTEIIPELSHLRDDTNLGQRLEIEALYEFAVAEQASEIMEVKKDESLVIPKDFNYNSVKLNLSFEEREKLLAIQPSTVSGFKHFSSEIT